MEILEFLKQKGLNEKQAKIGAKLFDEYNSSIKSNNSKKESNIPDFINFYEDNHGLLLQINDKQLIFASDNLYWLAQKDMYKKNKVKCTLKECQYGRLKVGDFFVHEPTRIYKLSDYCLVVNINEKEHTLLYCNYDIINLTIKTIQSFLAEGINVYKIIKKK